MFTCISIFFTLQSLSKTNIYIKIQNSKPQKYCFVIRRYIFNMSLPTWKGNRPQNCYKFVLLKINRGCYGLHKISVSLFQTYERNYKRRTEYCHNFLYYSINFSMLAAQFKEKCQLFRQKIQSFIGRLWIETFFYWKKD